MFCEVDLSFGEGKEVSHRAVVGSIASFVTRQDSMSGCELAVFLWSRRESPVMRMVFARPGTRSTPWLLQLMVLALFRFDKNRTRDSQSFESFSVADFWLFFSLTELATRNEFINYVFAI